MKKMKSLIALLLAACLLVSCGAKAQITIPADLAKSMTSMDLGVKDTKYESMTTNSDGSITYEITEEEQREILDKIKETFEKAVPDMQKDPIKHIDFSFDFTTFKITTSSTSISLAESLMTIVFYVYGMVYTIYDGRPNARILVEFINEKSGDIIKSFDSDELKRQFSEQMSKFQ